MSQNLEGIFEFQDTTISKEVVFFPYLFFSSFVFISMRRYYRSKMLNLKFSIIEFHPSTHLMRGMNPCNILLSI